MSECPLCKISEESINRLKKTYRCPECGFEYKEKKWAEKCQAWCRAHKACNLEITKHAIKTKPNS